MDQDQDPEPKGSGQLIPGTAGIDDEAVAESAPMVRALVVARLEMIWRACEPHILPPPTEPGELARRPDPRFVEAGIRVNDRLISLYGLLRPQPGQEEAAAAQLDQVKVAQEKLRQLEVRLGTDEAPRSAADQ